MKRAAIACALAAAAFLPAGPAFAQLYPFGGPIVAFIPPPLAPCILPTIIVGPPMPGMFVLPPITLFPFFNIERPGAWVLGLATDPVCGVISMVGTSL